MNVLRPNIAMDAPPTAITVGGFSLNIETDYRVWLEVVNKLRDLNLEPKNDEQAQRSLDNIHDIIKLLKVKIDDEHLGEFLRGVIEFSRGYPLPPSKGEADEMSDPVYSFNYDLNYIVLAIRNQSGKDIGYKCKHFHWWEFLMEFRTLCGDHYILNLMEIRGYKGKDDEMKKRKRAAALPIEMTQAEKDEYDEFSSLFDTEEDKA